jgi:hypothetical protein
MMNNEQKIEGGSEPAYPGAYCPGMPQPQDGLTARQRAAIDLRVPDSGEEWLDKMIIKARRFDLAGHALAGILSDSQRMERCDTPFSEIPGISYNYADAMLEASDEHA